MFAQDVSTIDGDTASVRHLGTTPQTRFQAYGAGNDVLYYTHLDHLGAVLKVTDPDQTLVWDADRSPFGGLSLRTAQIEMPLRFSGQYFDQETGLHCNYFRNYDPTIGRYIEPNPNGLDGYLNCLRKREPTEVS